ATSAISRVCATWSRSLTSSSQPGCGCHGHRLSAVEKSADEVDVGECLQGLVPVVGVLWPGVRDSRCASRSDDSMPAVCPGGRSTATHHVKITSPALARLTSTGN